MDSKYTDVNVAKWFSILMALFLGYESILQYITYHKLGTLNVVAFQALENAMGTIL